MTTLEAAEAKETFARMDDENLVFVMYGLLCAAGPEAGGGLMFGAQTPGGAMMTRCAFSEIAARWIPAGVNAAALAGLIVDGDESRGGDDV